MKSAFYLFLLLSFSTLSFAQFDTTLFKGMSVRHIGPAGMSGRVTSIDVYQQDPTRIYVGSASGGLWYSENGGTTWNSLFEKTPVLSVGAVAVQQNNPDVIWAGTGEGNPRNSQTSGAGIYKSIDGGATWKLMGLEKTKTIHRIIIHRDNPDVVFVAAMGSAWGPNEERGVYKTTDGGKTWRKVLYANNLTGCADLITDPTNPNKLIAAMWQYIREPWFFKSGGEGSGIHISYDGGETWKKLSDKDGLPKGELGRSGLALCHSKPNIVYALIESKKTGIYKSTDGGTTWDFVNNRNIGNRPFYYADIYVDPQNENRIYNLYSVVSKSEDGGKSFQSFVPYAGVHPDHHAMWINPQDPEHIIEGNDGGLNITRDGGETWRFVENLPVAQFYHINYDMDVPYNVYGGMQDNGSWVGPSQVYHSGGIRNSDWSEVLFGDGFDVVPNPKDSRYGYAMYQGGNLHAYDRKTGHTEHIQPTHPDSIELRFNWNAAIAQNPHNDCGLYYGSQFVHKSTDCGQSWKIISPDLTTNDTSKQKQAISGGLTIDATKAENYTTITAIAPSPIDKNVIWVGTDDGNLWVTRDGGKEWNKLNKKLNKIAPEGAWIPQIVPSKHEAHVAFVVVNDYRRNDWQPYAVKVTDYGKKMVSLVTENIKSHCLSIEQDHIAPNLLFLGTETGLFFSVNGGEAWHKWTYHYPSVSTIDLKIHPRESDLIIGTFGRACYIIDDIKPLRDIALSEGAVLKEDFKVFNANEHILASWAPAPGTRFSADAIYSGENTGWSASFTYYKKPEKKGEENEKEKNSKEDEEKKNKEVDKKHIHVHVIDLKGDTLRSFKRKVEDGFNTISWHGEINGIRFPGSREKEEDDYPNGGRAALPGNYAVLFDYAGKVDTARVTLKPDPRRASAFDHSQRRAEVYDSFIEKVIPATEAFDFLKQIEKDVASINKRTEYLEDSVQSEVKKKGKQLLKEVSKLKELYTLPEDFEGYDHVTVRLNDMIYTAIGYISSAKGIPGPNAMNYVAKTEKRIKATVEKVNALMVNEWKEYVEYINTLSFPNFDEYEPIELK